MRKTHEKFSKDSLSLCFQEKRNQNQLRNLETDESVNDLYLLIYHQLKLVVNETGISINRFNGF